MAAAHGRGRPAAGGAPRPVRLLRPRPRRARGARAALAGSRARLSAGGTRTSAGAPSHAFVRGRRPLAEGRLRRLHGRPARAPARRDDGADAPAGRPGLRRASHRSRRGASSWSRPGRSRLASTDAWAYDNERPAHEVESAVVLDRPRARHERRVRRARRPRIHRARTRRSSTSPSTRRRLTPAGPASACRPRQSGRRPRRRASSSTRPAPSGSGRRRISDGYPGFRRVSLSRVLGGVLRERSTASCAAVPGRPTRSSRGRASATGTSRSAGRSSPGSAVPAMREGLLSEPKELGAVWLYDERGSQPVRGGHAAARVLPAAPRGGDPEHTLGRHRRDRRAHADRARLRQHREHAAPARRALGHARAFRPVGRERGRPAGRAPRRSRPDYPGPEDRATGCGNFQRGLDSLPDGLIAFLGSTIGNLYPEERARFFAQIRSPLLVSLDLVKDPARLEAAYDDATGVTERFARNALDHANRELGADFDQASWRTRRAGIPSTSGWISASTPAPLTTWRSPRSRSTSTSRQGEQLRIEVSAKFRRERIERELDAAGLRLDAWWTDAHERLCGR